MVVSRTKSNPQKEHVLSLRASALALSPGAINVVGYPLDTYVRGLSGLSRAPEEANLPFTVQRPHAPGWEHAPLRPKATRRWPACSCRYMTASISFSLNLSSKVIIFPFRSVNVNQPGGIFPPWLIFNSTALR